MSEIVPFSAVFHLTSDALCPATVEKGDCMTPVWIQQEWQEGEFACYIQKNGCGHCCATMALRLSGIPDITPHDEYVHCRALWGEPDEAQGQNHFLSVAGVEASLRSYGVNAKAYGFAAGQRTDAVAHILAELRAGNLVLFHSLPLLPDNPFSPGAHYVLFVGLSEDGRVMVANSSRRARTDTPGVQLVTAQDIEGALSPDGCDPHVHSLTWGVLYNYKEKLGYIVIERPSA